MKKITILFVMFLISLSGFSQDNPPTCGEQFYDAGGPDGLNPSVPSTVTICPDTPGQLVTVTFTQFNTFSTFDGVYVYDGDSTSAPLIPSSNGPGFGGLSQPGAYWGTTLPGPFVSTSPDGCLTFQYVTSGFFGDNGGWVADVTCIPGPTCPRPSDLAVTVGVPTNDGAQVIWTASGSETSWLVFALPCNSPAPTAATPGGQLSTSTTFVLDGLDATTCYEIYVIAVCSESDSSTPLGPQQITTPPQCGGQFYDGGGPDAPNPPVNSTVTICPDNIGDFVTVVFSQFDVLPELEGLYVYDGSSTSAPLIASGNGAGPTGVTQPGAYWGTEIPGPFEASNPEGCLTFEFISNGNFEYGGWVADILCALIPICKKPTQLSVTNLTTTGASLTWDQPVNPDGTTATEWEVVVSQAGTGEPTTAGIPSGAIYQALGLLAGTCYEYYVRAVCSASESSQWAGPFNFCTPPGNDQCLTAIQVMVNQDLLCSQKVSGTLDGATASGQATTCSGSADDDVWFQFIASDPSHAISLSNINPPTNITYGLFTGSDCENLTEISCSGNTLVDGLTIGQTYYIRIYSTLSGAVTTTFDLCVGTLPCSESPFFCSEQSLTYPSATNVPGLGTIGCLSSTINANFFFLEVNQAGALNYLLTQSTTPGGAPDLDVDYVVMGPFIDTTAACSLILSNALPAGVCPALNGCSDSPEPTETICLPNAQLGEVYVVMIVNFSNQPGFVTFSQTNTGSPDAGLTRCSSDNTFNYDQVTYCQTGIDPTPTLAVDGVSGVYSSSDGLVIDPATGTIDLSESTPGSYIITSTLTITDETTFTLIRTRTVVITPAPQASIAFPSNGDGEFKYCSSDPLQTAAIIGDTGGTFSYTPNSGGLILDSLTGAIVPNGSNAGLYTVVYSIAASGGCDLFTTSVDIEILNAPDLIDPAQDIVQCEPYTFPTPEVGNYFSAAGGTGNILDGTSISSGTLQVYLYASNGLCSAEETFSVTINTAPVLVPSEYADISQCQDFTLPTPTFGNYYLAGQGGTGVIQNGATITSGQSINYVLYVQDGGCPAVQENFTVSIQSLPTDVIQDITADCSFVLPALSANNTYYSASGGPTGGGFVISAGSEITSSQSIFIYADNGTCQAESNFIITINAAPNPDAIGTSFSGCDGAGMILPALNVGGYFNSPGGVNPLLSTSFTEAGVYNVYVYAVSPTNAACFNEYVVSIEISQTPVLDAVADITSCNAVTAADLPVLTAGAYFNSPGGVSSLVFPISSTQQVYVYASNDSNTDCFAESTFTVTITSTEALVLTSECQNGDYVIQAAGTNGSAAPSGNYVWTLNGLVVAEGVNVNNIEVTLTGDYLLTYTSNSGCITTESLIITSTSCSIQKGISVNGDGLNDTFDLTGSDVRKLQIFNRYGLAVYAKNNYVNQWGGQTDKGEELPDGTYYYIIEYNVGEARTGWIYINRAEN